VARPDHSQPSFSQQFRLAVFWALLLTGVYTFTSRLL